MSRNGVVLETLKDWVSKLYQEHAKYLLGMTATKEISIDHVCGHAGRYNTAYKALLDAGYITLDVKTVSHSKHARVKSPSGYAYNDIVSYAVREVLVNEDKYQEEAPGIAAETAPIFDSTGWKRDKGLSAYSYVHNKVPWVSLMDPYMRLDELRGLELLWVALHKDDYDFKTVTEKTVQHQAIYPKALISDLGRAYYIAHIQSCLMKNRPFLFRVLMGKTMKNLGTDLDLRDPWRFFKGDPKQVDTTIEDDHPITEEDLTERIITTCELYRVARKTSQELLLVRKKIRDLGGSEAYNAQIVDLAKQHMIDSAALYINEENKEIKALAMLTLEGEIEGQSIF